MVSVREELYCKKIVFRVDSSIEIGSGHVMRCLTLADQLMRLGANCTFITRAHPGNMADVIKTHGYDVVLLPKATGVYQSRQDDVGHASWLGVSWERDEVETRAAIGNSRPDWLIVDHYGIDASWHRKLRDQVSNIMVIDDLADRPHACELILDQNLGRKVSDYEGLVPDHCKIYVEPEYALLRPEFATLRNYSLQRRKKEQVHQLLISMGGVDQHNATGQVLEGLKTCQLPADFRIIVIMGKFSPWLGRVQKQAKTLPWQTEVLVGINDMAQRMADSDLAIGAAGATSWERCCLGLPTLILVLAENQKDAANHLAKVGAAYFLTLDESLAGTIRQYLSELLNNPGRLATMSEKASWVTNGNGCQRAVNAMRELVAA